MNEQIIFEKFNKSNTGNNTFKDDYNRYFNNILTLASVLDLNKKVINRLAEILLVCIEKEQNLYSYSYISIEKFIELKSSIFNKSNLKKYIRYFLNEKKGHNKDDRNLYYLLNCSKDEMITESQFNLLVERSINICEKCKELHSINTLIQLFNIVNSKRRENISDKILCVLTSNFDFKLFYYASFYDMIKFNLDYLIREINDFNVDTKPRSNLPSIFGNKKEYHLNKLDEILDLCFKYDLNTQNIIFDKFKVIHPYYKWILDIDGFDYTEFKPEWINDYKTKYYAKIMSKSQKLKSKINEYLKENFNDKIATRLLYITYYEEVI